MLFEWVGPDVRVHPSGAVDVEVRPPGAKSLTNRYLLCAALADGVSTLSDASPSDDAKLMLDGLRALGIAVESDSSGRCIRVHGCRGILPAGEVEINAGAAGTVMRFLTALVCLGHGRYRLDGSPRMRERPIGALVDALVELGAAIGYDTKPDYPPLTLVARGLTGGQVDFVRPLSSQFVSAVLMVAPYAASDVLIRILGGLTSRPYLDMTIDVMRRFGVEVLTVDGSRLIVPATQRYRAGEYEIEPDASGAAYFWSAAAITGGRARVRGLAATSAQGDVRFVDVLERMGCRVVHEAGFIEVHGPAAGELRAVSQDMNDMPDLVQTLAVTALFARGRTEIYNVASLRIKETDRLAALATELTRLGARVETSASAIAIEPPEHVKPAALDTYDDHRMAMSFALAGLAADGVVIRNAACVSKSFPGFYEAWAPH